MRVELNDVSKRFDLHIALAGVTVSMASGERIALTGPNGSGKSTLLRALMGLVRCEGQIRLDGVCPFQHRERTARELAYVPQIAPQLGASVRDVVLAVSSLRSLPPDRVRETARRFELDLNALARKPFRALSGGMKQKLLLSCAFASPARLRIFDEPTASLDTAARAQFDALFAALPDDCTVLICSHRTEEVHAFASRVLELAEGKLAADRSLADSRADGPAVSS